MEQWFCGKDRLYGARICVENNKGKAWGTMPPIFKVNRGPGHVGCTEGGQARMKMKLNLSAWPLDRERDDIRPKPKPFASRCLRRLII
jgi:hypothetical protein